MPCFLDNERSAAIAQKMNKVAISHDSTHIATELRDKTNLLSKDDGHQGSQNVEEVKDNNNKPTGSDNDDSEFSADMDVASELDNKNKLRDEVNQDGHVEESG